MHDLAHLAADGGVLFVDGHTAASGGQANGGAEAADARADNGDIGSLSGGNIMGEGRRRVRLLVGLRGRVHASRRILPFQTTPPKRQRHQMARKATHVIRITESGISRASPIR